MAKKKTAKKAARTHTAKKKPAKKKKWIQNVKTVSTYPPAETFTKDAQSIARIMASRKVSPRGLGSAIKMVQYFINRSGKGLSAERKRELEKAKRILQEKLRREKEKAKKKQGG